MAASRKPGLLLAAAALLLFLAPPALAQDDAAKEQAKALFKQGREHFQSGRFADALTAFEQANAIKPHPLMLYNIGQVHEAMNDLPRAVETYEKFLASGAEDADDVKDRLARIRKTMAASWTTLELTSEPLGASIWINARDGAPRGRTPAKLQLPAGNVTLILEKDGFRQVQRPLKLQAGKAEQLAIVLPPMQPIVSLRSTPPGARVSIDGTPVGVTPLDMPLPAGKHTATLEVEGRDPVTREFDLGSSNTPDRPLVVDIAFNEQVAGGFLEIEIDRPGAEVIVDGAKVGVAPLSAPIPLAPGAHRLEVRDPAGGTHEETVIVTAGETARTEVELGGGGGGGVSRRTLGLVGMGVGGAVMAGGAVFAVLAASASSDLDACRGDNGCNGTKEEVGLADDVRSNALLTDVLIGGGIAIAATGAILWFLSDEPGPATAGRPVFGVAPTPGGGAAAVGSFEF
jgi:hypothetical protein